jgi:hypothetical protein
MSSLSDISLILRLEVYLSKSVLCILKAACYLEPISLSDLELDEDSLQHDSELQKS